jgi:hypothetical protein
MFTHPETRYTLSEMDYWERLKLAAQDRLAAAGQAGERSALPIARTTGHFAPSWLSGMLRGLRSVKRVELVDRGATHGFAVQSAGKA